MQDKKRGVLELLLWACIAVMGIVLVATKNTNNQDNNKVKEETTYVNYIVTILLD